MSNYPNNSGILCQSGNEAALETCCKSVGSGTAYMTYRNMTILNTSYAEAAECYVSQNYPKAGSKFVDCAMKTFSISDRNQLIPGNAAINCRGGVPPVYNGAQTTTSAKWAAVALAVVVASTVVAL